MDNEVVMAYKRLWHSSDGTPENVDWHGIPINSSRSIVLAQMTDFELVHDGYLDALHLTARD